MYLLELTKYFNAMSMALFIIGWICGYFGEKQRRPGPFQYERIFLVDYGNALRYAAVALKIIDVWYKGTTPRVNFICDAVSCVKWR